MALTMIEKPTVSCSLEQWPERIRDEFVRETKSPNGCVGHRLLSETDKVRVWRVYLRPRERVGFHRHQLDYFWSAVTSGRARQHFDNGETREYTFTAGETRHESYRAGEYKVHDLENIGDTELIFVTVEFLDGANPPLPVPDTVRVPKVA